MSTNLAQDHRVVAARKAIAKSQEARGTDANAYQLWAYCEQHLLQVLEAVDEGAEHHREALTEAYRLGAKGTRIVSTPGADDMTRDEQIAEAQRLLAAVAAMKDTLTAHVDRLRKNT